MSQRRMPSGQGPARGRRPSATSGPRPSGQRGNVRRASRLDSPARPGMRAKVGPGDLRDPQDTTSRRCGVRRTVGPARRIKAPRTPSRVSGRAAVVGLLLLALALAYAYPVRVYLGQQSQLGAMETSQREQRERIRELTEQVAKWGDVEYVIAQARSRLHFVRKGEVLYIVGADPALPGTAASDEKEPWFHQLWSNVQAADNPSGP
jgi:cell division protein FtsB